MIPKIMASLKNLSVIISILLLLPAMAITQDEEFFYTSNKLDNLWQWSPAVGDVDHYVFAITKDNAETWIVVDNNVPSVLVDGKVQYRYVSPQAENYRVSVIAVDAEGNQGPRSHTSFELRIFLSAGTPEFIKE